MRRRAVVHAAATDRSLASLVAGLEGGDARSLARALTMIERATAGSDELLLACIRSARHAPIIGITGAPGVGKSTLVNRLIDGLRETGLRVAVVAVDPSSPYSGGAVLGDRLRMHLRAMDQDVFIRSLSAGGSAGGLADAVFGTTAAMMAAGWDIVLVETVGAGQSELEIAELADLTLVVLAPGMGDEIQAIKAGILEIADVLVVNKADLPGSEQVARDLEAAAILRRRQPAVPVLRVCARDGTGMLDLIARVRNPVADESAQSPEQRVRRRLARLLVQTSLRALRRTFDTSPAIVAEAVGRVLDGRAGREAAARGLWRSAAAVLPADEMIANEC